MKIAFLASDREKAQKTLQHLTAKYPAVTPEDADVIVAIGGDGFMLQILHTYCESGQKVYGINQGTVGFMMNPLSQDVDLMERIGDATQHTLCPLELSAVDTNGKKHNAIAFNEVSAFRMTQQAIKLQIAVQNKNRLDELVCDGILVATPAGSTAYNLSAHGPVLPIDSNLLALTPISAFRPRRWRGALLPDYAKVTITCIDTECRPVSVAADNTAFTNIQEITIQKSTQYKMCILTDYHHDLEERIISEQFF